MSITLIIINVPQRDTIFYNELSKTGVLPEYMGIHGVLSLVGTVCFEKGQLLFAFSVKKKLDASTTIDRSLKILLSPGVGSRRHFPRDRQPELALSVAERSA
jgi:hypothetical protein